MRFMKEEKVNSCAGLEVESYLGCWIVTVHNSWLQFSSIGLKMSLIKYFLTNTLTISLKYITQPLSTMPFFYTSVYFQDLTEGPSFQYDVPGHLGYIWPKAKGRRMIHLPLLKKGAGFCPVSGSVHFYTSRDNLATCASAWCQWEKQLEREKSQACLCIHMDTSVWIPCRFQFSGNSFL